MLERRLVHTRESLAEFLDSSVYHLIAVEREPASTSAAIKSLVSIDLPLGLPSFSVGGREPAHVRVEPAPAPAERKYQLPGV